MKSIHVPRRFVRSHWGGTETVILQTCRQLVRKGHAAKIVTPLALSDQRHEELDGIAVERYPYSYPWFGLDVEARKRLDQKGGNLFSFSLLRALQAEKGLDILHLHTGKRLGGIVRHAALKLRIPYVVSIHGGVMDVPGAEAATFAEPTKGKIEWGKLLGWWVGSRRVFDDAAAILTLGAEEQRLMAERHPGRKVVLFPNGVDTQRFASGDGADFRRKHGIAADARVILVMGRIDPQKNQLLAVQALAEVLKSEPHAHLLLIGHVTNDAYHATVQEAIRAGRVEANVTLIPGVASASPDLVNAFHAADIFLLPSIHEPFGIVILEAWAAGLPVVASRVGGIPTLVDDARDAILFDSGDVRCLAEALKALLVDAGRSKALAAAGRAKANARYSWDSVTDKLLSIYEEAIRECPLRK